jgi:hypothetical protein
MKEAPIFNSENHMFNESTLTSAPPQHIRAALVQEAVHGQSATTCWVWQRSTPGDLSYTSRPLCANAVAIANLDMNRAAKEITALQQAPEQVTILSSVSALVWDTTPFTVGKSSYYYDDFAMRVYGGLTFCRVRTGYINERQLEAGILPKTNVLIVPFTKYLTNAAFLTLKNYKGHIIYLGSANLLCYDEYGKTRDGTLANVVTIPMSMNTGMGTIHSNLLPKLISWGCVPKYDLVDSSGSILTRGIELREADVSDGTIVDVCDYIYDPITVKLVHNGQNVTATDVLTGEKVTGLFNMKQFDFRLLKINN